MFKVNDTCEMWLASTIIIRFSISFFTLEFNGWQKRNYEIDTVWIIRFTNGYELLSMAAINWLHASVFTFVHFFLHESKTIFFHFFTYIPTKNSRWNKKEQQLKTNHRWEINAIGKINNQHLLKKSHGELYWMYESTCRNSSIKIIKIFSKQHKICYLTYFSITIYNWNRETLLTWILRK